ncbi:MAG: TrmB family transcriptional regulator sugar-binding domain-containing protein [Haloarculaceae archaeon]
MTGDRLRENLELFGLSPKEIDTYLTILDHGEAQVSEIVADAGVSQRYVYEMCEKLDGRGLVVLNDHVRPSMVRALDPETATDTIENRLEELRTDIAERLADRTFSELSVELIKSQQTLFKRSRHFIDEATEEVFLCVPATAYRQFHEELVAARERDVAVYLLLTDPGLDALDVNTVVPAASVVRVWEYEPSSLLSVDYETTIYDEWGVFRSQNAPGRALSLAHSAAARPFFDTFVSNFWRLGQEVSVCEPDTLPHAYSQLRKALLHGTLHEHEGRTLRATIEAKDTATGEEVTMTEVPIREIRQGLVEPFTNTFPVEDAMTVEFEGEEVTVGGSEAFLEEYEALEITLLADDERSGD